MFPIRDTVPNRTLPVTTWLIIIQCGIVFFFETTLPHRTLEKFIVFFGIVPVEYTKRHWHGLPLIDYISFLTTMFLHGGWLHFLGNMWFLKIFGSKVEDRMGHRGFLVFYLISGILASVFYIYFSPRSSMPVIGASGAIAGVMGAYYVMSPGARILTLIPILIFPWFVEIPAFFSWDGGFSYSCFPAPFRLPFPMQAGEWHGGDISGVLSPVSSWFFSSGKATENGMLFYKFSYGYVILNT